MREIKVRSIFKSNRIELYEGIKELPITRYNQLQKLFLMDSGIGADMNSVAQHFGNLYQMLSAGETEKAVQEARNLHNNFFYILNETDFKSYIFASLIHSINGKQVDAIKDQDKIVDTLVKMKITYDQVQEEIEDLKKNLIQSWLPTFLVDLVMEQQPMSMLK